MKTRFINTWIIQAGHTYWLTERRPNDPDFKRWATREVLAKYWNMGKRPYTEYDAE